MKSIRVLVVGVMAPGSNSRSMADGFAALGCAVRRIDTSAFESGAPLSARRRATRRREASARDQASLEAALAAARMWRPNLVLAIKTVLFDQERLLDFPNAVRMHLSFDDVRNIANTSPSYLLYERHWDWVVTTKSYNVPEIEQSGGRSYFINNAFDPTLHFSAAPFNVRPLAIGFIGAARRDRRDLPVRLGRAYRNSSVVYGPRWRRQYPVAPRGVQLNAPAVGASFAKAASTFRAGLVLLNSENRDLQTARTFEVPASGNLVVATRSKEHERLFAADSEAIFIDSLDDLDQLSGRLLRNDVELAVIAENGRRRVFESANTYTDRARELLSLL